MSGGYFDSVRKIDQHQYPALHRMPLTVRMEFGYREAGAKHCLAIKIDYKMNGRQKAAHSSLSKYIQEQA